jgi:molybdenum cofactor guanylyltransferase
VKVKDKTTPLIAVYNRNLISDFKENLIKEELRLTHIVSKIPNKTIDVPEKWCELLQNINTKEDYQNLLQ